MHHYTQVELTTQLDSLRLSGCQGYCRDKGGRSDCPRDMLHQCAPPCVATIAIAFPAEIIASCVGLYFRFALTAVSKKC
jgi:hypothetical protein